MGRQRRSVRDVFHEFTSHTSAHGISHADGAPTQGWRRFWWCMFFVSALMLSQQLVQTICKYYRYEKVAKIELNFGQAVFPAITICSQNPYKASRLQQHQAVAQTLSMMENALESASRSSAAQAGSADRVRRHKRSVDGSVAYDHQPARGRCKKCRTDKQGRVKNCFIDDIELNFEHVYYSAGANCICDYQTSTRQAWPCFPESQWHKAVCAECKSSGHCKLPPPLRQARLAKAELDSAVQQGRITHQAIAQMVAERKKAGPAEPIDLANSDNMTLCICSFEYNQCLVAPQNEQLSRRRQAAKQRSARLSDDDLAEGTMQILDDRNDTSTQPPSTTAVPSTVGDSNNNQTTAAEPPPTADVNDDDALSQLVDQYADLYTENQWQRFGLFEEPTTAMNATDDAEAIANDLLMDDELRPLDFVYDLPAITVVEDTDGLLQLTNEVLEQAKYTTERPVTTTLSDVEVEQQREVEEAMGFAVGHTWLHDVTDELAVSTRGRENLMFAVQGLDEASRIDASHSLRDLTKKCVFAGAQCDFDRDFTLVADPTFGNCFTYNFNVTSSKISARAGRDYGLRLQLYTDVSEQLATTESVGFQLVAHAQLAPPFAEVQGVSVATGTQTSLVITRRGYTRLPRPYGECYGEAKGVTPSNYVYRDKQYTVEGCFRSCNQQHMTRVCGCAHPMYPLPVNATVCRVDNSTARACLERELRNFIDIFDEICHCPPSCDEMTFGLSYSESKWLGRVGECGDDEQCRAKYRQNAAIVQIYYSDLSYESFIEEPAYTKLDVANDFGGIFGLWLGCSLLSFLELFIFAINLLKAWRGEKRAEQQRKRSESELRRRSIVADKHFYAGGGNDRASSVETTGGLSTVIDGLLAVADDDQPPLDARAAGSGGRNGVGSRDDRAMYRNKAYNKPGADDDNDETDKHPMSPLLSQM